LANRMGSSCTGPLAPHCAATRRRPPGGLQAGSPQVAGQAACQCLAAWLGLVLGLALGLAWLASWLPACLPRLRCARLRSRLRRPRRRRQPRPAVQPGRRRPGCWAGGSERSCTCTHATPGQTRQGDGGEARQQPVRQWVRGGACLPACQEGGPCRQRAHPACMFARQLAGAANLASGVGCAGWLCWLAGSFAGLLAMAWHRTRRSSAGAAGT